MSAVFLELLSVYENKENYEKVSKIPRNAISI